MNDRMKIGAAVGAITVTVVVLVFIFIMPHTSCRLQQEAPKAEDANTVKNVTSDDYKALASFSGYLIYTKKSDDKKSEQSTYLPLELEYLKQSGTLNGTDANRRANLTIETSCSDIVVNLVPLTTGKQVQVTMSIDNISSDGDKTACTIDPNLTLDETSYYTCKLAKEYPCISKDKSSTVVAKLHVDQLEFEFDGNPDKIKKHEFSKKAQPCKA